MIYFKISLLLITAIVLIGCTNNSGEDFQQTEWLTGTWEMKTQRGSVNEEWRKTSKNELSGKSFVVQEADTFIYETIQLVLENKNLFYIPTVKGQNENLPVRFSLKSISKSLMEFENPEHDYPQKISYRKISEDSLVVEISGIRNGEERSRQFPMRKIK